MELKLLMSRIVAAVNRGDAPDGAALATEYNAAVGAVTARLEAVQTAVHAGQTSEALRIMEDEPRLLDAVSTLEFVRLAEWEALCVDCRWPVPEKVDKTLLERVVLFAEGKEVVEPLLKMYRRAMRTHNVALAVRALRQLAVRDTSQDWSKALATSEAELKKERLDVFLAAQRDGHSEQALRAAVSLFEDPWLEPVKGAAFQPAKTLYEAERRREREARIADLLDALASCLTTTWNRMRAKSLVADIEGTCGSDVVLTDDQRALVEECRTRYESEDAAETAEREAQRRAAEAAARKKLMTRVSLSVAAVFTLIAAVTTFQVVRTSHERGVQGEIVRLDGLLAGVDPIPKMEAEIARIQSDYPKIWADGRVAAFADKLEILKETWCTRTNEIAAALAKVESLHEQGWPETAEGIARENLETIGKKIRSEDRFATARFAFLRDTFTEVTKRREVERMDKAEAFGSTMMDQIKAVSERLAHDFPSPGLAQQVERVKATMAEWERCYASCNVDTAKDFADEKAAFLEREKRQIEAQKALEAVRTAVTASALEAARLRLVRDFADYGTVRSWRPVWATAERVKSVFSSQSDEMKRFKSSVLPETSESEFKDFTASLRGIRELEALYSLYGVREDCERWYNVIAKGRPIINEVTRGGKRAYTVSGSLLMAVKLEIREEYEWTLSRQKDAYGNPVRLVMPPELLPPSKEYREVVNFVADSENLTQDELADEFLKRIEVHTRAVSSDWTRMERQKVVEVDMFREIWVTDTWIKAEREAEKTPYLAPGRYPASARVQMLDHYCSWLQSLNRYGKGAPYEKLVEKCTRLAKPVHLEQVEDALTWACTNSEAVRRRNTACADFLEKFPKDFAEKVRKWNRVRGELARHVGRFTLRFAGKTVYDPVAFADYPRHVWIEVEETGRRAPLYVLRQGTAAGTTVLRRAFDVRGTTWHPAAGMAADIVPGEPLFCVMELTTPVQAEGVVQRILGELDGDAAQALAAKIPHLEL